MSAAPFFTPFLRGAAYSSFRTQATGCAVSLTNITRDRRHWHRLSDQLQFAGDEYGRCLVSRIDGGVFRAERGAGLCLRKTEEAAMSWLYILSGALALAIFVYLIIALLFPEKF
jgi:K+-transporting ATPase KdpF subunit